MKVLSLFSGVGGFDMGLENAGMETVFQCEWDKHANSILHRHWPDVPKWDDVSTLTGKHILANAPVVDVVAWGSPCQDLSLVGKRAGLEGGRSGLFHEGIRIIKELQEESNGQYPRISIWENVVGALNSNRGADFGVILDEMAQAGALAVEWSVLDAQYFGIPQRRRRVFVIAIFDPVLASRCPNQLLPVAESLPGHLAKGKPQRQSTTRTVAEGVGAVQYDGYNQRVNETDVSLTIRIGRDSSDFIAQPTEPTMALRRLTPLECERLMGWPDNHTLTKADGTTQADTHRYKQCGNGVASPVAQWIAKHLLNI